MREAGMDALLVIASLVLPVAAEATAIIQLPNLSAGVRMFPALFSGAL
jgi:hypothetical protein